MNTSVQTTTIENDSKNGSFLFHPILALTSLQHTELAVWLTVTFVVSFIGACASLGVLLVTWPKRHGSAGVNLLIFHFMVVDLIVCLIIFPMSIGMVAATTSSVREITYPASICQFFHLIFLMGGGVINWADTGIALNRCIALCMPHRYRTWATGKGDCVMILLAWLFSLATIPYAKPRTGIRLDSQSSQYTA